VSDRIRVSNQVTIVRHLVRSSRWRQALVWSCVPYLLLSTFGDFLHVHPLLNPTPRIGIVHAVQFTPRPAARRVPETSCAICLWQRVGSRLQNAISAGPAALAPHALVAGVTAQFPLSPVPHPSAYRGPPQLSLF
jgi:hypothetical protein